MIIEKWLNMDLNSEGVAYFSSLRDYIKIPMFKTL